MASYRIWRDKKEKKVILDSSAIMMPFEFSIDLEDELTRLLGRYHIFIPTAVISEIEFLSKYGKGRKKNIATASLKLIGRYDSIDSEGSGDDAVFNLAKKMQGIVVTNDKELRKRLVKISIPTIFLRAKKQLAMDPIT